MLKHYSFAVYFKNLREDDAKAFTPGYYVMPPPATYVYEQIYKWNQDIQLQIRKKIHILPDVPIYSYLITQEILWVKEGWDFHISLRGERTHSILFHRPQGGRTPSLKWTPSLQKHPHSMELIHTSSKKSSNLFQISQNIEIITSLF